MGMTLSRPECVIRLNDQDFYLVDDVAGIFGVEWRTVMRWLGDGKLTRVKYPNGICIPASEVEEMFAVRNADGDRPQGAPPPPPKPSDGPGRGEPR